MPETWEDTEDLLVGERREEERREGRGGDVSR